MLRKISIAKASIHPLIKAWPDDALGDIHEKLCKHNSVVVVDTTGHFQGIISRKDVVKAIITRSDWKDIPVDEVMTKKILYVPSHVSLAEAVEIMLEADISRHRYYHSPRCAEKHCLTDMLRRGRGWLPCLRP